MFTDWDTFYFILTSIYSPHRNLVLSTSRARYIFHPHSLLVSTVLLGTHILASTNVSVSDPPQSTLTSVAVSLESSSQDPSDFPCDIFKESLSDVLSFLMLHSSAVGSNVGCAFSSERSVSSWVVALFVVMGPPGAWSVTSGLCDVKRSARSLRLVLSRSRRLFSAY